MRNLDIKIVGPEVQIASPKDPKSVAARILWGALKESF